ncbi:hypothetical protein IEQ34_006382 [Dendrobium chrysotoxum]|uniref:Ubiquitin-like protease family profile domain-containing protein n=1 Tax=Dendrobium chrysotoxum TaxID=161865 RepID=A0AAV7HES9_DENCH|nr:hypothetical protein IEQ34_006382 [Dendrobium chrysotoxum]
MEELVEAVAIIEVEDSKTFVPRPTPKEIDFSDSIRAANLLLLPVVNNQHLTLLIIDLKSKISLLYEEIKDYFTEDIGKWPLITISDVST